MQQNEKSKLEQNNRRQKKNKKEFTLKQTTARTFARKKKKNLLQKQKNCRSFLTKKHQANPISLLLSSQEEAGEVRHRQFLHLPVTDRFAILQNL